MSLERLIAEYVAPQSATTIIEQAKIALLVGISGAGKDTIKRGLLRHPEFTEIVSHTTRAPRTNEGVAEVNGVDYHFITEDQALDMLDEGAFVEAKFVHGTVYGTSVEEVGRAASSGIAITDVDVQGVTEYKRVSSEVVAIFVVPPSYDVSEDAFMKEWPRRRESAMQELTRALEVPYYHFVINDDLERATAVAYDIARRPDSFNRKDDEARILARDLLQQIAS